MWKVVDLNVLPLWYSIRNSDSVDKSVQGHAKTYSLIKQAWNQSYSVLEANVEKPKME